MSPTAKIVVTPTSKYARQGRISSDLCDCARLYILIKSPVKINNIWRKSIRMLVLSSYWSKMCFNGWASWLKKKECLWSCNTHPISIYVECSYSIQPSEPKGVISKSAIIFAETSGDDFFYLHLLKGRNFPVVIIVRCFDVSKTEYKKALSWIKDFNLI